MKKTINYLVSYKVKEAIARSLSKDVADIYETDDIFDTLCEVSWDAAFLVLDLEEYFSCKFSNEDIFKWRTVGDIINTMVANPAVQSFCLAAQ